MSPSRIRDGLAMLARQECCQLFLVAVEECDEIEEHARPDLRVAGRPLRLGGGGICHRGGEFVARCERDAGLNLAGVGVVDIAEATALAGDAPAGDEMPQFLDHDLLPRRRQPGSSFSSPGTLMIARCGRKAACSAAADLADEIVERIEQRLDVGAIIDRPAKPRLAEQALIGHVLEVKGQGSRWNPQRPADIAGREAVGILAARMRRDHPQYVEPRGLAERRKELGSGIAVHDSIFTELLIWAIAKC